MTKKELKKLVEKAFDGGILNPNAGTFYIGDHDIKLTPVVSVIGDNVIGVKCKFGKFGYLTLWSDYFDRKGMIKVFTDFLWKMF